MCTGATYTTEDHYFGRNLDLDHSYRETVAVTPRNYPFAFRKMPELAQHHAIIGMATISGDYPLYYDGTNEKGLSMAGLAFAGNAVYRPEDPGMINITPIEFIPWILGNYTTYENSQVTGVDMHKEELDGAAVTDYPIIRNQQILMQN